jgi:hypothetical protein
MFAGTCGRPAGGIRLAKKNESERIMAGGAGGRSGGEAGLMEAGGVEAALDGVEGSGPAAATRPGGGWAFMSQL